MDGRNLSREETRARILHLAEDVGYRLRSKQLYARGVYVWVYGYDDIYLHKSIILKRAINTDQDICNTASQLFQELPSPVRIIGITLYKLQRQADAQLTFYQDQLDRAQNVCSAIDKINYRFGARKIHSAASHGTEQVKTKIPFGSTRYLDRSIT